ncbi:hypothetical protein C0V97_04115 [Asaia sp. W19]|uniref:hypothetical protein n=1 Tax=unclassified Asaia TaxID=2685023 RepID=UPI000F8DCFA4|nr:hypothetical protein [Asaia sp. W19]RUT26872.1 hypothetical protein C0V97_04115 [Asaia sp. W19]
MSISTRIAALQCACKIHEVTHEGLTETLLCASAMDRWLTTHPSRRVTPLRLRNLLSWAFSSLPIHKFLGVGKDFRNVASITVVKMIDRIFSFGLSNRNSKAPDKGLSRGGKFAHEDSSSGFADGESAGELPTPSRTDDALPLKHAASVSVFDAHIARRFEVKS